MVMKEKTSDNKPEKHYIPTNTKEINQIITPFIILNANIIKLIIEQFNC